MRLVLFFVAVWVGLDTCCQSRYFFTEANQPLVINNGDTLDLAWFGGLNSPQFSKMDINGDNVEDLVIFDRSSFKTICLQAEGKNSRKYTHVPKLETGFPPELVNWALFRDYNCDGKKDIFTSSVGGIHVYENVSADTPIFVKRTDKYLPSQQAILTNLYVPGADIPAIEDIDGDGDLDILTFGLVGSYLRYHQNLSMEKYGVCDSLTYELKNRCWGHFSEGLSTNDVKLFDTCNSNVIDPRGSDEIEPRFHAGSTVLSIDLDGNKVYDVVLGDISFNNAVSIVNGGTAPNTNSSMKSTESNFPSNSVPIDVRVFPAIFHVDVDNDGRRDLLASPNVKTFGLDNMNVWYYANKGTDDVPIFDFVQKDFLTNEGIDMGRNSVPVLFDLDGDKDLDLFIGGKGDFDQASDKVIPKLMVYENTGNGQNPKYELYMESIVDFQSAGFTESLRPTFGDLDNDGDPDMLIGDKDGHIHYFPNIAGANKPMNFGTHFPQIKDKDGNTINVGVQASPFLFDIDEDDDLDLIIGEEKGNLNFYRNESKDNYSFELITDSLGDIDVGKWGEDLMGVPYFFKDTNGKIQLFMGSADGHVIHYNDISGNLGGSFNPVDTIFSRNIFGSLSSVAVGDLNGDNIMDLIAGNARGGLQYLSGIPENIFTSVEEPNPKFDFGIFPNPASDEISLKTDLADFSVHIYDMLGRHLQEFKFAPERIDVSNLSNGTYLLQLKTSFGLYTKKFSIQKGN